MTEVNELLTITQATKLYPRNTHRSTVLRHILRGVKTPVGVVKLEGWRFGGRWTTSQEAIDRFMERLTVQAGATPPKTISQQASIARSEAYLKSLGML